MRLGGAPPVLPRMVEDISPLRSLVTLNSSLSALSLSSSILLIFGGDTTSKSIPRCGRVMWSILPFSLLCCLHALILVVLVFRVSCIGSTFLESLFDFVQHVFNKCLCSARAALLIWLSLMWFSLASASPRILCFVVVLVLPHRRHWLVHRCPDLLGLLVLSRSFELQSFGRGHDE